MENEISINEELNLDDLDVVAGGVSGAGFVELDGQVTAALPNAMFQVQLDDGNSGTYSISGQLRMNYIRIQPGNRVRVQTRSDNTAQGRIVYRYK